MQIFKLEVRLDCENAVVLLDLPGKCPVSMRITCLAQAQKMLSTVRILGSSIWETTHLNYLLLVLR